MKKLLLSSAALAALVGARFSEPDYDAIRRDRELHNKKMKPYRDNRRKKKKQALKSRKRNRQN